VRPCRTCEGGGQNYGIIARIKTPAWSWAQADADVRGVRLRPAIADLYRIAGQTAARERLVPLQRIATREVRQPILILWGAVAMVLLIGCVNIAGLLMGARRRARPPKIATRMALGRRARARSCASC